MAENIQDSSEHIKLSGPMSSTENMHRAGAIDANVKHSRPNTTQKGGTLHWFACIGPEDDTVRSESVEERDNRLKMLREKQNEERQKKLEELKAQALAAQRFREMKEEERRRRIEELRTRDNDRRQQNKTYNAQVGERKRLIYEAERDRRESILKKNQEREARFDLKKRNERSSMAFAFGSSTPRMLEPADTGGSFWGHRRATSTNNIMFAAVPLTRRSSERELDGSKKRATSAGGLDRSNTDDMRMSTSMYEVFHWGDMSSPDSSGPVNRSYCSPQSNNNINDGSTLTASRSVSSHLGTSETIPAGCVSGHVGRRRTDLMPTIPIRDTSGGPTRKPFTKSPGRTYSLSRLDQLAKPRKPLPIVQEKQSPQPPSVNSSNIKSMSRSMGHLAGRLAVHPPGHHSTGGGRLSPPQRPLRKADSKSMHQLSVVAPVPPPRTTRAVLLRKRAIESPPEGPSRPDSSLSHQSTSSVHSSVTMRSRPIAAPRKPRPASIAVTGVSSSERKLSNDAKNADISKPPLPRSRKTSVGKVAPERTAKLSKTSPKTTPKVTPLQSPCTEAPAVPSAPPVAPTTTANHDKPVIVDTKPAADVIIDSAPIIKETTENMKKITESAQEQQQKQLQPEETIIEAPKSVPQDEPVQVESNADKIPAEQSQPQTTTTVPVPTPTPVAAAPAVEDTNLNLETADMTASMIAKVRITTEEEAKAALAERRRLAREEAERQAEAERLRIEEEFRAEQERQRLEEEQARILVEHQRHAEEERLAQAIKETQKREEEERLRREEELKQKLEKEEQERKAREESEKQRIEMQKRLEQEEKEREARRKRVEAIMLRTRASKGGAGNNQQKDENTGSEKGSNEESKNQVNNKPTIESYEKEVSEKEAALFNGSFNKSSTPVVISKENGENGEPQHSNGHRNGVVDSEDFSKVNKSLIEHNVTNTLLDLGELDPFKNANTNLDIPADKITNEDNVNSNNTTESHSTTDFLL